MFILMIGSHFLNYTILQKYSQVEIYSFQTLQTILMGNIFKSKHEKNQYSACSNTTVDLKWGFFFTQEIFSFVVNVQVGQ